MTILPKPHGPVLGRIGDHDDEAIDWEAIIDAGVAYREWHERRTADTVRPFGVPSALQSGRI